MGAPHGDRVRTARAKKFADSQVSPSPGRVGQRSWGSVLRTFDYLRLCRRWRFSVDLRICGEFFPLLGLGMPELLIAFSCGLLLILARPLRFHPKLLRCQQMSHRFQSHGAVAGFLPFRPSIKTLPSLQSSNGRHLILPVPA